MNVSDYVFNGTTIAGIIRCPKIIVNNVDINSILYTGTIRASANIFLNNVNLSTTFTTNTLNTTALNVNGVHLNQSLTTTTNTTTLNATTINTNIINYNYSTIPTYISTNLGSITILNYTGSTSIGANAFANLSASIPIGIYFINAYALFTITTVNTNSKKE